MAQGGKWSQVGNEAATLHARASGLLATTPDHGDVYWFNDANNEWKWMGTAGSFFAMGDGVMYGVDPGQKNAYRRPLSPLGDWAWIGGSTFTVYPGRTRTYAAGTGSGGMAGDSWQYVGSGWMRTGGPGHLSSWG